MTKKIEKKSPRSQQNQSLSALWLCFLMFVIGYLAASWFDVNQCVNWISRHFSGHATVEKKQTESSPKASLSVEKHPKLEFYTLLTSDAGVRSSPSPQLATSETINLQYKNTPEKTTPVSRSPVSTGPMELAVTAPTTPTSIPAPTPAAPPEPVKSTPAVAPPIPKPTYYPIPKPVAPPPPVEKTSGRYVIQVGSFRSLTEANRMRDKLGQKGYGANIVPVRQQMTTWYRVMIGPFSSLGQAQQIQYSLSHREHITGMIRKN